MIDYGRVRSTVCPKSKEIDKYSVWVHADIKEVEENIFGKPQIHYEYGCLRYTKDEYLSLLDETNAELEAQLTDTQLALCEVYELML